MTTRRLILAAALLCATSTGAWAQDEGALLTGTLATVARRGTIMIGTREGAVPFSFATSGRAPEGFSIDLCHGVAEDVARALNRDLLDPDAPAQQQGLRIVTVPVAADARLAMLTNGAIDLECGSTTATAERAKTIAFSPVFFLAGTKLLVPRTSEISSYRDLAGKVIVVTAGTTNATVMHSIADATVPHLVIAEQPSVALVFAMLARGEAQAMASDDVLLAGLVATEKGGDKFVLVDEFLSFEPYAIGLRRDDQAFADLIRASFERMAVDGELGRLYDRWFTRQLPGARSAYRSPRDSPRYIKHSARHSGRIRSAHAAALTVDATPAHG